MYILFFFFFFQAEDGIRDHCVTGVQTCALPISDGHDRVVVALRRLPVRQREAVVLRYYLDLSETDIAATMGVSAGSVKTHLHRGLAALGRTLEPPAGAGAGAGAADRADEADGTDEPQEAAP